MRNVEIRNYRGDGLSFQQDIDVTVDGCHLHHNTGGGLHPGSGSVRYILQGNRIHDNGGCGIFYCLRTTHSLCRDNRIENNAGTGISIGERHTDHAITGNTIRGQGGAGISFRPPIRRSGDRFVLRCNSKPPSPSRRWVPMRSRPAGHSTGAWQTPANADVRRYNPRALPPAITSGRLLVLSPFPPEQTSFSAARAAWSNQYVLHLAHHIVIGQLSPDGMLACLLADMPDNKPITILPDRE